MSNHCYQVKIQLRISEEDVCLAKTFSNAIFQIKRIDEADDDKYTSGTLAPRVLDVQFDKCDPTNATFFLFVDLSAEEQIRYPLDHQLVEAISGITDIETEPCTTCPDADDVIDVNPSSVVTRARAARFEIYLGVGESNNGQQNQAIVPLACTVQTRGITKSIAKFKVNPLPDVVCARGFFDECDEYEIHRVRCQDGGKVVLVDQKNKCPSGDSLTNCGSLCLRIVVPLTKKIKCLVPDFGLSGAFLNRAIETQCKTKVRIEAVSTKKFCYPALLTFDKRNCTACLEISFGETADETEAWIKELTKDFTYLFDCDCLPEFRCERCERPDYFAEMGKHRRFNVLGVAKCTEDVLFSFELCNSPAYPVCNVSERKVITEENLQRVIVDVEDYCYEYTRKKREKKKTKFMALQT